MSVEQAHWQSLLTTYVRFPVEELYETSTNFIRPVPSPVVVRVNDLILDDGSLVILAQSIWADELKTVVPDTIIAMKSDPSVSCKYYQIRALRGRPIRPAPRITDRYTIY